MKLSVSQLKLTVIDSGQRIGRLLICTERQPANELQSVGKLVTEESDHVAVCFEAVKDDERHEESHHKTVVLDIR